jgi:hypothetical protein
MLDLKGDIAISYLCERTRTMSVQDYQICISLESLGSIGLCFDLGLRLGNDSASYSLEFFLWMESVLFGDYQCTEY